jgi:hypothetical protein
LLFPDKEPFHSRFCFYDEARQLQLTDVLEMHYLELPKFELQEPPTSFETWLYTLKYSDVYLDSGNPMPKFMQEEEGVVMAIDSMRKA